jgi:hypothetical protein
MTSRHAIGGRESTGLALVTVLLLLLVMTILAVAGIATATIELQSAANVQYLQRAFEAAEYANQRALAAPDLRTGATLVAPARPACAGNCVLPVAGDSYDYSLYYDDGAAGAPFADGGHSIGSGIESHHFIVESLGQSARGARSEHVQGFVVPGPGDD